jgi:putative ABC transport system permease protein
MMAILGHAYWTRRYGGRPDVIGQSISTSGPLRLQVVGVLPPGVELLFPTADNVEPRPDLWVANRLSYDNANRNGYSLRPVGRLRPGVTLARAQDDVEAVSAEIRASFPVYGTSNYYARVEPMHRSLVANTRPAILALMGAVVCLLLIACANVANLLLVRAASRETELAVKTALGAGGRHLARQLLSEALVIGAFATSGGVALAWVGVEALRAAAPADIPRLAEIGLDPRVLAFALASGLAAALVFGIAPAWSAMRLDVMSVLRRGGRTEGLNRGRLLRHGVVVAEVALCFVLLIGSGLMVRSFRALQRIDPGFSPDRVLTFQLLGGRGGPPPQRAASWRALRERLSAIPGVEAVTASTPFPLAGGFSTIRWGTEAALADNSKYQAVDWQRVLPGYFEALGVRLLEGRTFTPADNDPGRALVVVDQMLAAKAFPHESAVGRRILIRIRTAEPEWVEIIGVVAHQRATSLADPGREQVYVTDGLLNHGGARTWAVRAAGDPAALTASIRAAVAEVDPQLLMTEIQPLSALVERAQADTRFQLLLISLFAAIAAVLAAVGLYGVLSTVVRQRTGEIGVRVALGASPAGILREVVGQGLRLSLIGVACGLAAALALTRTVTALLVGVPPIDPLTYGAAAGLFFLLASIAAWLPARRAAALDPTAALRT